MRRLLLAGIATVFVLASASHAADKPPSEADGIRTLFVEKGSASAVLKAINALHAKMEAEGWSYRDMSVYTEDGDLEGVFVTYARMAPGDGATSRKTEGSP
jgi:hypothetical protein